MISALINFENVFVGVCCRTQSMGPVHQAINIPDTDLCLYQLLQQSHRQ